MDVGQLENLAALRTLVGYLGEREQCAWWPSAFFAPGSSVFLTPLFPRTQLLAQCNGVTQAAALVHDERIGVGQVYHLFRLPEDIEQGIHRLLNDEAVCQRVETRLVDQATALPALRGIAGPMPASGIGPTRIGSIGGLRTQDAWPAAAARYLHAFEHGEQVFPYFSL